MFGSHSAIIDTLTVSRLASAIGVAVSHIRTMKARDSIPPAYWPQVVAAAQDAEVEGVTFETLTVLASKRRQNPAEASTSPEAA